MGISEGHSIHDPAFNGLRVALGGGAVIELMVGLLLLVPLVFDGFSARGEMYQYCVDRFYSRGQQLGLAFPSALTHTWRKARVFASNVLFGSSGASPRRGEGDDDWLRRVRATAGSGAASVGNLAKWLETRHPEESRGRYWLLSQDAKLQRLCQDVDARVLVSNDLEALRALDSSAHVSRRQLVFSGIFNVPVWRIIGREFLLYIDTASRGGVAGLILALLVTLLANASNQEIFDTVALFTIIGTVVAVGCYNGQLAASLSDVSTQPSTHVTWQRVLLVTFVSAVPAVALLIIYGNLLLAK